MTDELDEQIEKLEAEWKLYHKDHKKYQCPDLLSLAKLKSKRNEIRRQNATMP